MIEHQQLIFRKYWRDEPVLALPPDIRIAVKDKINCQDSVRPDIILEMQGKWHPESRCQKWGRGCSHGSPYQPRPDG